MQNISEQFSKSVTDIEGYAQNIDTVIQNAFQNFSDGVTKSINESNASFHSALSQSVGQFAQTLDDLDGTMEDLGSRIENALEKNN